MYSISHCLVKYIHLKSNIQLYLFDSVVGGLLSAHLLSGRIRYELEDGWPCEGPLLRLAVDVAERLLPGQFIR